MKLQWLVVLAFLPVVTQAQLSKKRNYNRPPITLEELYEIEYQTRPEELALKEAKENQETAVHRQARSLKRSETTVERSRSAALDYKLIGAPGHRANLQDRIAASLDKEKPYPGMDADVAIMETIYRRMLDYRQLGFAPEVTTFFLGTGVTGDDPPSIVVDRMQRASDLGEAGLTMLPVSRSINVPRDAIRDRNTLDEGVIFRVDSIEKQPDGTYRALASFSQRDAFFFTREFVLRGGEDGEFTIISERDFDPGGI
ncbi:MAG: hypothetical protein WA771_11550 [Chthoniobacterales bacterium]